MNEPTSAGSTDPPHLVTRRRLLWLGGAAGFGAAATMSSMLVTDAASKGMRRQAATRQPKPAATSSVVRPLESPTQEIPSATPFSGTILCRESWGAQPPTSAGKPHTLDRMTLHHTGAVLGDNRNAPERLRQHQRLHQGERGWSDIAYHVGVDRNGNIYELREPTIVGDTATEYNPTGHFLVLCEGDFDQETVSEAQLVSAAIAFAWAAQQFNIRTDTLAGHREYASTACPGSDLFAYVASGDLKRRADEVLTAGPVNLQKICGPEASEKVASIEAGR